MSGEKKLKAGMFCTRIWSAKLDTLQPAAGLSTCRFGLTKEALKDVEELLEGVTTKFHRLTSNSRASRAAGPPDSLLSKYCWPQLCIHTQSAEAFVSPPCLVN